jgi:ethanolamine utilization protein EutA
MVEIIVEAKNADRKDAGRVAGEVQDLTSSGMLTAGLLPSQLEPSIMTVSGGVAEYAFGREERDFGDLGCELAAAIREASRVGTLPPIVSTPEGIRATVIGASQYAAQVSGSTVHVADPSTLPLRNLPVVRPRLTPRGNIDAVDVERAIRHAIELLGADRLKPLALAIDWDGDPSHASITAIGTGIAGAMAESAAAGVPVVIVLGVDLGRTLGQVVVDQLGSVAPVVAVDGIQVRELDYIDVGRPLASADVLPVVIKSLAFESAPRQYLEHQLSGP